MSKIADGLLSGRYSVPRDTVRDDSPGYASPIQEKVPQQNDKPSVVFQEGIRPIMFKSLVGKDHAEFSTMRQQDAGEFLAYLLEVIRRSSKSSGEDNPTSIFGFALEERLQCSDCRGVRYKQANEELLPLPVPVVKKKQTSEAMDVEGATKDEEEFEEVKLETCLDNLTSPIAIEYDCPACAKKVTAIKSVFPREPSPVCGLTAILQDDSLLNVPGRAPDQRREVPAGQLGPSQSRCSPACAS